MFFVLHSFETKKPILVHSALVKQIDDGFDVNAGARVVYDEVHAVKVVETPLEISKILDGCQLISESCMLAMNTTKG